MPMRTIAIGDIQGCYKTLQRLLERVQYNPAHDQLFLVGDLVNRGPDSLSVLRWAKELGDKHVKVVLGNHDLYLLSLYFGVKMMRKDKKDSLRATLNAPDCDELVAWLRMQPLLYKKGKNLLVHAGILPAWTTKEALANAELAAEYLRGPKIVELLTYWNTHSCNSWKKSLSKLEKAAVTLNVLTRMRTCSSLKTMDLAFSGKPKDAPRGLIPWFKYPGREITSHKIVFGHWAALGYKKSSDFIALDSGCVWGGSLTAYCLEDKKKFSVRSVEE